MELIIDKVDSWIGALNGLLAKLYGLPYLSLCAVVCFLIGLCLRYSRQFPNSAIPLVVVGCGGLLAPILADPAADNLPIHVWLAKNVIVGMIIGMGTWIAHRYALKPIARKVPWLAWLAPSDGDTEIIDKTPANQTKPDK